MNLAEPPLACLPVATRPRFCVYRDGSIGRDRAQRFIQHIYRAHYGATIRAWTPTLVTLEDDDGIQAAAGYRIASAPLFLERYLREPVESAIAQRTGAPVSRCGVVEVGHFSSAQPGAGRRLMALLGRHLVGAGHQWVVSTATEELRLIFRRLRLGTLELGRADPALIGDAAADWGSYYDHAPLVLAGEIRSNVARFARDAAP